jgi:hypothetical protein
MLKSQVAGLKTFTVERETMSILRGVNSLVVLTKQIRYHIYIYSYVISTMHIYCLCIVYYMMALYERQQDREFSINLSL